MTNKNVENIKEFLKSKQGYLKEGAKRLQKHLLKKGFVHTVDDCRVALREGRAAWLYNIDAPVAEDEMPQAVMAPPKILFYDIETSYNVVKAWRTGYNLTINPGDILHERAIICVSYKWEGEDEVYNLQWDHEQSDKDLLERFIPVLNEADVIVAHNGDRFDIKWIKTRALFHGLQMRINYPSVDTLKLARKKFNFNSNKLDYISEYLGFDNKNKTTMALWDNIILNRCPNAMMEMVEYCNKDVILLEKVYEKLVNWELPKVHVGVHMGLSKATSPHTGGTNLFLIKTVTSTKGAVKYIMLDADINQEFEMSQSSYKKYLKSK